jgi:UDP-N-acetylglucosamine--N-acetylmuramyl-(pentapeptide) pyrophosphoryl-undecaprenol N-acetylglucosamine transferase
VVPAIAVADALRAEGASVSFVGTPDRSEAELVPAAGYEIDLLRVSGLSRRNPLKAAAAVGRAARAVGAAGAILRRRGADAALGGGGYVAGPVGLAAVRAGLPLVLTEADSHLGLANRLLARRARRVCLAFPIPGRTGERYLVTGRPVPRAVLEADHGAARERFGIGAAERCLAVFGGSQGAHSINEAAFEAFAGAEEDQLLRLAVRHGVIPEGHPRPPMLPPRVLHISGRRDYPGLRARLDALGSPGHYTLIEYEPHLGEVLAACDLVVARAGGSVFEIAAAGRPAVLIPYPHATANHQEANARWMADGGAAVVMADSELGPTALAGIATGLLFDEERRAEMAAASRRLARPDAAERVAAEVLATIQP